MPSTTGSDPSAPTGVITADSVETGAAAAAAGLGHPGGRVQGFEPTPDTPGGFFRAWLKQLRTGDIGVLPVVGGLILLVIIFQAEDSLFLSAGNLTNLLTQGAVYMLLGMAEVFVLLLGEIDLSIGYLAGIGAAITCLLAAPPDNLPWWVACLAGLAATTAIGTVQGILITRLGLPSFVVTLAGLLGFEGLMIDLINSAGGSGTIPISNNILNDLAANGNLSPVAGWVVMALIVGSFGVFAILRDRRRRASGLHAPPASLTLLKVAVMAGAGVLIVLICNMNRGLLASSSLRGVPWVVLIVLAVLGLWSFLLGRTRFGRYIYAIGGNAEAARRAGVNLRRTRTKAFALSGLTSGIAGIVYASRLGSISTDIDGGTLVLYAVAAAVIGGTSLAGGRGKMLHALLGGLVIAAIYNGLGLLGLTAATTYMVAALVLLVAVIVDATARRGRAAR